MKLSQKHYVCILCGVEKLRFESNPRPILRNIILLHVRNIHIGVKSTYV